MVLGSPSSPRCKFAIPLVRLDSEGIQKVRQTLPARRNPFCYYRRVIVSIDTLKNPIRYRHHLQNQRWDAVVIDECHNLINRGTQVIIDPRLVLRVANADFALQGTHDEISAADRSLDYLWSPLAQQ